eukprot:TRINITY_DN192_c0_g1_i2.p1 TRINITY_DN192_c0_g1~~TRINITY_DN192_c0_g1_i2.p1  ORF type:complete len:297 (-),score=43.63 TRINITY_DN192_c0_g1_i2:176-1042(-)
MVVSVTLALSISLVSFGCIRLLDLLADADCTGDRTDDAIKQIIRAIGILVGFGWEQCFDVAVEELSEAMPPKIQHWTKMALGLFCICIITPAWKWHLLPMAIREGWNFGFVIDADDDRTLEKWEDLVDHLKKGHEKLQKKHVHRDHQTCDHLSIAKVPMFGVDEGLKKMSGENRKAEMARLRDENESLRRDLRIARETVRVTGKQQDRRVRHQGNSEPSSPSNLNASTRTVTIGKPQIGTRSVGSGAARATSVGSGAARATSDINLHRKVDKLEELTRSLLGSRTRSM